jgi:elongation factor P
MKINGNEIRPGNVIEHKGGLWVAVKTQHVKPGKGPAYAQVELKNAIDGTKLNERFRSSETVERVRLEQNDYQFLYAEGDMLTFMDVATYDQIQIPADFLGGALPADGMVTVEAWETIGITLPVRSHRRGREPVVKGRPRLVLTRDARERCASWFRPLSASASASWSIPTSSPTCVAPISKRAYSPDDIGSKEV